MTVAAVRQNGIGRGKGGAARDDRFDLAHPTSAACSYMLIKGRAEFERLETEWDALFARSGKPTQVFQTHAWCRHWCDAFLTPGDPGTELAVVTGRAADGRLVLVLPLVKERSAGLTRLVWLGEPVSQYGDALVDENADAPALLYGAWQHLTAAAGADLVHLRKVRADAMIAPLLQLVGGRVTQRCEAPSLDLAGAASFAAYEQRYAAKARKNRRRLMRRLEEQGPVVIEHLAEGQAAVALARHALDLKRTWLKSRGMLSPALSDPRTTRFFEAIAGDTNRSAGARVSVLRVGSAIAGVQVGFVCKGRLSLHVIVYDLAFEKSGVGVLHLERAIAGAIEAGYGAIDLLAPNADYKMDWADGTTGVDDVAVPLSLRGQAFVHLYLGHVRHRLKSLAGHMPGFVRSALTLTTIL
jgi:CelD/BcsL family acetyltransferase involved in cellulose biosynthesis